MLPTKSILLASIMLTSMALFQPVPSFAQPAGGVIVAQQEPPKAGEDLKGKKPDEHRPAGQNKPGQPQTPAAQQTAPPSAPGTQ